MTRAPTPEEILDVSREIFAKLQLTQMLEAADPGASVSMPMGRRATEVVQYVLAENLPACEVPALTAAEVDRLLEVVALLYRMRQRTGKTISELVQRLALLDNMVIDARRSRTMAQRVEFDDLLRDLRRDLDDLLTTTGQKIVDLAREFDERCEQRIAQIDDALNELHQRSGDEKKPPMH
jgi:hypothetical protein